ncbi:hypothetical protein SLEP1_g37335 [Rubroshorea leprosula]|uniref:Uncharacterized protein n=1 Tax=Rubroshorea leprosula TaxID=152421 RepID=A0AAV5KUV0_9ROSI|nr:hypothetical protein SLEP1_g37335 [Rubroshorea leprosula]
MTKPNDLAAQPCHVFSITKDFLPSSSSAMEEEVEVSEQGGEVGEHGGIRAFDWEEGREKAAAFGSQQRKYLSDGGDIAPLWVRSPLFLMITHVQLNHLWMLRAAGTKGYAKVAGRKTKNGGEARLSTVSPVTSG